MSLLVFQFHKGTIRTKGALKAVTKSAPFQFHKGTIRTHSNLIAKMVCKFHFNSIKVRLERDAYDYMHQDKSHFNSIKVRLERNYCFRS